MTLLQTARRDDCSTERSVTVWKTARASYSRAVQSSIHFELLVSSLEYYCLHRFVGTLQYCRAQAARAVQPRLAREKPAGVRRACTGVRCAPRFLISVSLYNITPFYCSFATSASFSPFRYICSQIRDVKRLFTSKYPLKGQVKGVQTSAAQHNTRTLVLKVAQNSLQAVGAEPFGYFSA